MAPRRRCPVCGSKQWHKEPSSGLVACSEGHVLQNYRNEATEADEIGPHAVRKRALRSGRKKGEKKSRADPKLYYGARARYYYFQCQQLILRKQVAALITLWNLPPEFEVCISHRYSHVCSLASSLLRRCEILNQIICRDIYALHLSLLSNPPPPEPYLHHQETREGGGKEKAEEKPGTPESDISGSPPPQDDPNPQGEAHGAESGSPTSSEDEADKDADPNDPADGEDEDPELAALLRENSETSSSEDEDPASGDAATNGPGPSKRKREYNNEGSISIIAVLVLACWTLRIPVMYMDFARVIESYELPYLDPVRHLPQHMTVHLTKHNIQALTPAHAPSTLSLHVLTSRLAKRLYSTYGIFTPEANAAPILWRAIQCLGGTPTLYILTKRLSHILSLPLTLHHSLAPGLERIKRHDPQSHQFDNVPPELGFVAATIVVLKMVYGLDGRLRLPSDPDDPACALPRIDEYISLLKELNEVDSKRKDAIFNSQTQMPVGDLSDDMLDEYLEFCERALLGTEEDRRIAGQNVLANYFPLPEGHVGKDPADGANVAEEYPRGVLAATLAKGEPDGDGKPLRPGDSYTIYNARDVLGSVPEEYDLVVGRAARWTGVPEEYVGRVVEKFERRVMQWWKRKKRRSQAVERRMRGGVEAGLDLEEEYSGDE